MANRVLLGAYAGDYRFRISKPGVDVLAANENGLMVSDQVASRALYRTVSGSVIVNSYSYADVVHPDYGQVPMIFYRASPSTADEEYNYIAYNFQVAARTRTGFRIYNDNSVNQRVYYYLWVA